MPNLLQKKIIIPAGIIALILIGAGFLYQKYLSEQPLNPATATIPREPAVQYNRESNDKMLQILKERPALSPSDKAIRERLITETNPLDETSEYVIEYLPSPDQFQVEIRTININQAKQNAVEWFLNQGLSNDAVCKLPLTFYLNYEVKENLRGSSIEFDPLPSGC